MGFDLTGLAVLSGAIGLVIGTSYADDPHLVRRVAIEAASTVPRVLAERDVKCHITGFGDSSIDHVLRVWIHDAQEGLASVRGGIYLALWDAFKENGISIPFPQREVRMLGENAGAGTRRRATCPVHRVRTMGTLQDRIISVVVDPMIRLRMRECP